MAFGWDDAAKVAAPLAGIVYNAFQDKDAQDKRQIRQQQKLTDMQARANQDAATYTSQLQYDMWKKTNYSAQVGEMEKAGLNPALMYGMGGGGGGTTGSASQSGTGGGQAANAAATEQNKLAMGMQLAQAGLIAAQTEKTKAETKNLEATTGKTGVETESGKLDLKVKQVTQDETIERVVAESKKAMAEAATAMRENTIGDETAREKIRTIQEEAINKILENKGQTIENKRKEALLVIEQFEAEMSKNGISPRTPWWMKLVADQLEKIGLNPLK